MSCYSEILAPLNLIPCLYSGVSISIGDPAMDIIYLEMYVHPHFLEGPPLKLITIWSVPGDDCLKQAVMRRLQPKCEAVVRPIFGCRLLP